MFEVPRTETDPIPSKKEVKIKPDEKLAEGGSKKKFEVEVLMKAWDKDGKIVARKKSEVSNLVKVVEVEAADQEEAEKIALSMDFGDKVPEYTESIKEIGADKKVIEKKTASEKLKEEAMELIKQGFRERQRPLKPDELKIVVPAFPLFSKDAQEIILAAHGDVVSKPVLEEMIAQKKVTKE